MVDDRVPTSYAHIVDGHGVEFFHYGTSVHGYAWFQKHYYDKIEEFFKIQHRAFQLKNTLFIHIDECLWYAGLSLVHMQSS